MRSTWQEEPLQEDWEPSRGGGEWGEEPSRHTHTGLCQTPRSYSIQLCASQGRGVASLGPREDQAEQGSPRHGARELEQVQSGFSVRGAVVCDGLST